MELGTFRTWLAQVDDLTVAQRLELEAVLTGRSPRAAVAAVIEADLDAHQGCPHCGHVKVVCCGKATKRGLSHEQVPIVVAAARGGGVISAVLEVDNGDAIKAVLEPVLSKDAPLVTDGGKALPRRATKMNVSHEILNQSAGERVRGEFHIQTVNSLHERIKTFLCPRRGVATKYLGNYLRWFHRTGLQHAPTARAYLNAAIGAAAGQQLEVAIST